MLDVGDLLKLRTLGGADVHLRLDDSSADPAVEAVLRERLEGGPVQVLPSGERVTLTARFFNRGWARYALLDAGVYVATLRYMPAWDDARLRKQQIGAVVSNEARLEVTRGAPESVSRVGIELAINLRRDKDDLVAELTNRLDQVAFVNLNFASDVPFATGRWVWELDGKRRDVPVITSAGSTVQDFEASRLVRAGPGESVELARIRLADFEGALKEQGALLTGDRWSVYFEYVNRCNRRWQRRMGSELIGNSSTPAIFRTLLPRLIPSSRHASNTLIAPRVP